jgi:hypothetical protein
MATIVSQYEVLVHSDRQDCFIGIAADGSLKLGDGWGLLEASVFLLRKLTATEQETQKLRTALATLGRATGIFPPEAVASTGSR